MRTLGAIGGQLQALFNGSLELRLRLWSPPCCEVLLCVLYGVVRVRLRLTVWIRVRVRFRVRVRIRNRGGVTVKVRLVVVGMMSI